MAKILLIEDDLDVLKTVEEHLNFEHYVVESVTNGEEGLERLSVSDYDVVIVDWSLPGMTGIELSKQYRASGGSALILMLTGKGKSIEKQEGLDAGCDDYLTKPFDIIELSARVRALLRRASSRISANTLRLGELMLDPSTYRVTKSGKDIKLVPKEFAILEFMMRHPNVVFSCEAIMSRVWKADEETSPEIIRTHIKNLRKKVESADKPALIDTVHGVGYKLVEPHQT